MIIVINQSLARRANTCCVCRISHWSIPPNTGVAAAKMAINTTQKRTPRHPSQETNNRYSRYAKHAICRTGITSRENHVVRRSTVTSHRWVIDGDYDSRIDAMLVVDRFELFNES